MTELVVPMTESTRGLFAAVTFCITTLRTTGGNGPELTRE